MSVQPEVVGVCKCGVSILGGEPVTVTPDGQRWHTKCRSKTDVAAVAAQDAPKRRGRPPKQRTPDEQ